MYDDYIGKNVRWVTNKGKEHSGRVIEVDGDVLYIYTSNGDIKLVEL